MTLSVNWRLMLWKC